MNVSKLMTATGMLFALSTLSACQQGGVHAVGNSSPAAVSAKFDQVKALEGDWVVVKMNGELQKDGGVISYHTASNGTSIREIMFAGTPHEMTNMYHMNGDDLMVTHYCGAGNQPRMHAVVASAGHIEFKTESVTNLATAGTQYMGELTLDMADSKSLKQTWISIESGNPTTHMVFELRRK